MNLVTIIPLFMAVKVLSSCGGGRGVKINCVHIESLFFNRKCANYKNVKQGLPVNQERLTKALRHAIMFL